jgi:DNA-binding transcriptional MocR family regulator
VDISSRIGARPLSALLPNLAEQSGPRYRALSAALAALLLDGRLAPGVRLPSERGLADALAMSRSTATAAYDDLANSGLLIRKRGSGSYLTLPANARVSGPGARMTRDQRDDATLDLSIACLPAIPGTVESATVAVAAELGRYLSGGGYQPYGLDILRAAVAERYRSRGVPTSPDEVLITNGAQHGFDLVLRLAINPGDRVLTELPTYPGALDAIRAHSARAAAVPFAGDGRWDATAISNTLQQTAPRLAFLIPDFHNPTGALADTEQRREVLAAARRAGTTVVIDESFVDIDLSDTSERIHKPQPMAALDRTVISIGSLSKPIWGGLRIGWIRADADLVHRLAVVRARSDMSGAVIDQLIARHLLDDLDRIVEQRCVELRAKRDALLAALATELPTWKPTYPVGGLSSWVELDAPAATALTHRLEQRGVLITPGSRFALDGTLERFLRIPFALPVTDLLRAIDVIAETWQQLGLAYDVYDSGRMPRQQRSLVTA